MHCLNKKFELQKNCSSFIDIPLCRTGKLVVLKLVIVIKIVFVCRVLIYLCIEVIAGISLHFIHYLNFFLNYFQSQEALCDSSN